MKVRAGGEYYIEYNFSESLAEIRDANSSYTKTLAIMFGKELNDQKQPPLLDVDSFVPVGAVKTEIKEEDVAPVKKMKKEKSVFGAGLSQSHFSPAKPV